MPRLAFSLYLQMKWLRGQQVKGRAQDCPDCKRHVGWLSPHLGCRALDTPALKAILNPAAEVISVTFPRSCIHCLIL